MVFESGAFSLPMAAITGNDNDVDAAKVEPHYTEITQEDQVQVYESMMVDPAGRITTGLLSGVRFVKDNRLLPRGMSRAVATGDIAIGAKPRRTRTLAMARSRDLSGATERCTGASHRHGRTLVSAHRLSLG